MSTDTAPRRPSLLRTVIGMLVITLGVCLLCWAVFNVVRGPGTCGGDAPACPDGFIPALLGGFASFFLVIPVGIALSPKVVGFASAVGALITGGLTTTVYAARFVADPVTESTVGTWIAVSILGTLTLLFLLGLLTAGIGDGDAARAKLAEKVENETSSPRTSGAKSSSTSSSATGSGSRPGSAPKQADPNMDAIRQLLLHGLANGELATKAEVGRIASDHKPDIQRLLDLHQRGVIDDDALRDALAALRTS